MTSTAARRGRDPSFNEIIKNAVDDYLRRHDISLNWFSEIVGVRQSIMQRFMTGGQDNLRLDTAEKICKQIGLELRPIGEREIPRIVR